MHTDIENYGAYSIVKWYTVTMKLDSIYYTPQQMADFYALKKDTLLYYDKIGLFSPALRKENGYRYYSAPQLNELEAILTLRDLGVPLASIKRSKDNMDTPSFIALLENEEGSIRQRIDECISLLNMISAVKASVKEAEDSEKRKLYKVHSGAQYIVRTPIDNDSDEYTSDIVWQNAYRDLLQKSDSKLFITIGSIVRLDEAVKYHGSICREVYATYASPSDSVIPEGVYAYMFFPGSLSDLNSFYEHFLQSLEESSLTPLDDIYEELTISSSVTQNEADHVTKLMVRVG